MFRDHDLRLFDGEAVQLRLPLQPRTRGLACCRALGKDEVDSIIAEQGAVTVTCEFCQRPYRFDAVDAAQLFVAGSAVLAAPDRELSSN